MLRNTTTSRDKGGPGTGGPWSPVVGESDPIHKPERKVKSWFCNKGLNWIVISTLPAV